MRLTLAVLAAALPAPALAGAWSPAQGEGQAIVKVERMRADQGYDPDGVLQPLFAPREDDTVSLFAEYGLTDSLTLQVKAEWQSGRDAFVDFEGAGPAEIGLRWQAWRSGGAAVSLYAGYAHAGAGRNAGYAAPGAGDGDWEVRAMAGHSGRFSWLGDRQAFAEVQVARRFRSGLPDEDRADVTFGMDVNEDWTLLSQVFAGQARDGAEAAWLNAEVSVVRRFGDWSVQAGWREAVAGRESPAQSGIVLGVWRRF